MKVKNYIKQHRARMNLTQDDLARKIGVSRQSISAIEKEQHYPSIFLSLQIAKALEMNIDVLFELIEGKRTRKKAEEKQEKNKIKKRSNSQRKFYRKDSKVEVWLLNLSMKAFEVIRSSTPRIQISKLF